LFEYCDLYKTIPLENIVYKNQKIGFWYKSQRIKIKTNLSDNRIIYDEFIQNIYIKDDLLKYADNIEKNQNEMNIHYYFNESMKENKIDEIILEKQSKYNKIMTLFYYF
jgi:hypothetical protein